eukprot:4504144-Alexandrium_andersonii.AAC.1
MWKPSAASLAWMDLASPEAVESRRDLGEIRSPCPTMALHRPSTLWKASTSIIRAVPSFLSTMSST